MIILDTDHVSFLGRGSTAEGERLRSRLDRVVGDEWGTTVITYEEQTRGWLAFVTRARTPLEQILAYRKLSDHLDTYRLLEHFSVRCSGLSTLNERGFPDLFTSLRLTIPATAS